jgi:uncharacterized protein (DUF1015 family)
MANIYPFRAWRYTGALEKLATQPYDTIPPELEAEYRNSGPHNLVHVILPNGDYAGAAARLEQWISDAVLAQDDEAALYVYEQRFALPETGERLTRRGFIGLTDLRPYGSGVYRHELTLTDPVADRLELLRATEAQFDSVFMMYPDPEGEVERLLEGDEIASFGDFQGTQHTLWRAHDPEAIRAAMRDRPLVIVDGHHRYEAALRCGVEKIMVTCVRAESPGLRTLAAHRLVLDEVPPLGIPVDQVDFAAPPGRVRFGLALPGELRQIELDRPDGALNLAVLHEQVLRGLSVRACRGMDVAIAKVERGEARAAFLVEPMDVAEVARFALAGKVLPQKSTDFYPKLASGVTIYHARDHFGPDPSRSLESTPAFSSSSRPNSQSKSDKRLR